MLYYDAIKLKEELRELFRASYKKAQLIQALSAQLNDYPQLKGTPFQTGINEFIVLRAEQDCEIVIHDDEIKRIWGH